MKVDGGAQSMAIVLRRDEASRTSCVVVVDVRVGESPWWLGSC